MTLHTQALWASTDEPMGKRQTDLAGAMEEEHHWHHHSETSWLDQVDEEEKRQSYGKVKSQVHMPGSWEVSSAVEGTAAQD